MAVIIDIDHETGDLTEYTATVTDSGDLSVSNDATAQAVAGTTYALKCVIDDTTAIYGDKTFTMPASVLRVRFYVDPNGLTMGASNEFSLLRICASSGAAALNVSFLYSGGLKFQFMLTDDTPAITSRTSDVITDAPHYVEAKITRSATADSNDATMEAYVDGVQVGTTVTGIDCFNRWSACDRVRFGASGGH